MNRLYTLTCTLLLAVAALGAPSGEAVYKAHCAACHDQNTPRIPPRDALQKLPATRILRNKSTAWPGARIATQPRARRKG